MNFPYSQKELDYLSARDPLLGGVIRRVGFIERTVEEDVFSAVVHHIIGQQISMKAQETVWRRLQELLGEVTPETLAEANAEAVKGCGMTYRKAEYICDFAQKVRSGAFDVEALRKMEDGEAVKALSTLRGVGEWTAEMLLLFCLRRSDVLSYGDLGIRRGMMNLYGWDTMTKAQFEECRERYSPYGSVASFYLWAVNGGAVSEEELTKLREEVR